MHTSKMPLHNMSGDIPASCTREKPNVLSILPLPDCGGSDCFFYSAAHLINPSLLIDNADNLLIAGSTLAGYCAFLKENHKLL